MKNIHCLFSQDIFEPAILWNSYRTTLCPKPSSPQQKYHSELEISQNCQWRGEKDYYFQVSVMSYELMNLILAYLWLIIHIDLISYSLPIVNLAYVIYLSHFERFLWKAKSYQVRQSHVWTKKNHNLGIW